MGGFPLQPSFPWSHLCSDSGIWFFFCFCSSLTLYFPKSEVFATLLSFVASHDCGEQQNSHCSKVWCFPLPLVRFFCWSEDGRWSFAPGRTQAALAMALRGCNNLESDLAISAFSFFSKTGQILTGLVWKIIVEPDSCSLF